MATPQANGEVERQNRSILKRLRIAQAEGKNLKSEVDRFLVMYRSTPHSTTGVSPAELLYGREYRTKLPQLAEFQTDTEVRDRDSEKKEMGKVHGDSRRNAQTCDIHPGDRVLLKQEKSNKLTTPFKPAPLTVMQRNGNSVIIEGDGVQYKRNITHVKKLLERNSTAGSESETANRQHSEPEPAQELVNETPDIETGRHLPESNSENTRPVRIRKRPAKLEDYIVGYVLDVGQESRACGYERL